MVDRNEYFDELEVMSPKAREEYYARKLQEQVKYAYEHAPSMRAKFDKAGISPSDIRTVRDLEKVPITRKDTLIDLRKTSPPFGGLLGVPREELEKVFMSPGPIYDFAPVDASFYRRFQRSFWAVGFRKGDMVVNCMSYHMVPAGHWIDRSLTTYGATVIPMGTGNTELQVKVLYDTKATGWIGICSFLMTILKKAEEMGYDPRRDFALRAAIPHAEVGGAEMRRIYEEEYGITSTDIYPTADVGVIAYECRHKGGMHINEEIVVEVVDPATGKQLGPGEVGEVVTTPLDSRTYPLIRFGTGDLSSYIDEPCPCGRTSRKLTKILGRVGDAVKARGIFIHPREVTEVVAKYPGIGKCQVAVARRGFSDEIILRLEVTGELMDRRAGLEAEVRKTFQDVCRLRLDRVDFVTKGTIPDGAKIVVDERVY